MKDFDTLQKLPKNVGDSVNLIVANGFKSCPKSKKLPNVVTLLPTASQEAEEAFV